MDKLVSLLNVVIFLLSTVATLYLVFFIILPWVAKLLN